MKKFVLAISVLLLFSTNLFSNVKTFDSLNGDYWINMKEAEKLNFIIGFNESIYYELFYCCFIF